MKFLILIAAFVGISYAQSCGSCDSGADRAAQTGCRLFCYLDIEGDGVITRDNFIARFNGWNSGNPVPASIFVPEITRVTGLCELEGQSVFALFAGVGGGNDDVIEESDMTALFEIFELITGTDRVDREGFNDLYGIMYDLIAEPDCS